MLPIVASAALSPPHKWSRFGPTPVDDATKGPRESADDPAKGTSLDDPARGTTFCNDSLSSWFCSMTFVF